MEVNKMTYLQRMEKELSEATTQEEIDFLVYQIECEQMKNGFYTFQDEMQNHRSER